MTIVYSLEQLEADSYDLCVHLTGINKLETFVITATLNAQRSRKDKDAHTAVENLEPCGNLDLILLHEIVALAYRHGTGR